MSSDVFLPFGLPARFFGRLLVGFVGLAYGLLLWAWSVDFGEAAALPWSLRTVADDSMSYLVMALVGSPWQTPPIALVEAWPRELYPPLFPALLAFSGAAHSGLAAHGLVVVLLLLALWQLYAWMREQGMGRVAAFFVLALVGLSPMFLVQASALLSEGLFLLLGLVWLRLFDRWRAAGDGWLRAFWWWCLCSAALLLTRSIAASWLLAAVALLGLSAWRDFRGWQALRYRCLPRGGWSAAPVGFALFVLPLALWQGVKPPTQGRYQGDWSAAVRAIWDGDGWAWVSPQLAAMWDGWFAHWLWLIQPGVNLPFMSVLLLLVLALWTWGQRLRRGRLDAWCLLAYGLLLVLWPYPGQMGRFLFPVLPFLAFYALASIEGLSARCADGLSLGRSLCVGALASVFLVQVVAADGFLLGRWQWARGDGSGLSRTTEVFYGDETRLARHRARRALVWFEDMQWAARHLPQSARVMSVAPGYVALLGQRRGLAFPKLSGGEAGKRAFLEAMLVARPDWIYLASAHPRQFVDSVDLLAFVDVFRPWTDLRRVRHAGDGGPVLSVWLKPNWLVLSRYLRSLD